MRGRTQSVLICRLPDQKERFRNEAIHESLGCRANVDRPSIVLDCSSLCTLDRSGLNFLLCYLEEAMKRNGDVRLAGLCPEVRSVLRATGVDSLFQCFETVGEAVESYHRPHVDFDLLEGPGDGDQQSEMSAA